MSGKIFSSPTSFDKIFKLYKKKVHLLNSTVTCCLSLSVGFASGSVGKESTCQCRRQEVTGSVPGSRRSSGGGNGNLHQYSCLKNPTDRGAYILCVCVCMKEDIHHCNALPLNTLVYILYGEGNGNPLQYSGLENPTDRGACWATVHGDRESQT